MNSLLDAGRSIGRWLSPPNHHHQTPHLQPPQIHKQVRRLRSNSSSSLPSTPEINRKGRKREMSVCVESVTQKNSGSVDCNLNNKRNHQRRGAICQEGSVSFFNRFFLMLNDRISLLSNRGIRAPRILNYMHSLNVSIEYPLSPFNEMIEEDNEFDQLEDVIPQEKKVLHIVDGGLAMNLPFAPILRPQRAVDIIISFDFTARQTDDGIDENFDPLKQVRLAEKWARMHALDFPRVPQVDIKRDGIQEVYDIHDYENHRAPVIIHFVLVSKSFKNYAKPKTKRATDDKRGQFKVFENPVYSTFNFTYEQEAFDNLSDLMEYNVLNNIDTIKEQLVEGMTDYKTKTKTMF